MLLNWVLLLPLSLAAICPMERHQVCNLIAADDAEHVRDNRHRCTCAITPLSDRPPPEQSCTNFITLDEEEKSFPVVSITFNLKESPELEAFPEESFRDTIAGALRVNQDNILLLRVNCKGTKDTLTVQFGVLKPQSVAELKKKPKKRTVKGGRSDDDNDDDDDDEEEEDEDEEEEAKDDNEGEGETSDAKGDDKNRINGRKHDDDDDSDEKVKGNAREDDADKKEDGEGRGDGDDDENDDEKGTISKIKKHGRKHTKIEAKKSKDEKSKKDHKDIASLKKDDKKISDEDGDDDDDGDEGDEDDDDDGKRKSIGEKDDDDEDDDRKHKSRGKKDDEDDDDKDDEKHKKKKPVKGKSKHRHDDDDDKKEDDDNEDDDNDDDDEEGVEKDDEDDEDEEEEDEKTKEETEEEKDDDDDDDNDDEEEEEEEGEIDYEKVKYVADQFLDAQSIATRMKAMGHLNQIADLQVDSIEFTEDIIEVEYNPDNSALIVQTASAGGLFLFFLIIGTWCMWRRNMFDYSDDLQKV